MMELIPAGICGIMPGLALADGLNRVFDLRRGGDFEGAMRLFEAAQLLSPVARGVAAAHAQGIVQRDRKPDNIFRASTSAGPVPKVFSLQNMELFLYCEKRLLELRGLLSNSRCRTASLTPDAWTAKYADQLNQRILRVLREAAPAAEAR